MTEVWQSRRHTTTLRHETVLAIFVCRADPRTVPGAQVRDATPSFCGSYCREVFSSSYLTIVSGGRLFDSSSAIRGIVPTCSATRENIYNLGSTCRLRSQDAALSIARKQKAGSSPQCFSRCRCARKPVYCTVGFQHPFAEWCWSGYVKQCF